MKTNYVDFETARAASGLRLVTLANVPSPWSEAAKGIFHVEKIPFVATRLAPGDQAMREWTGVKNAPAVMWNDEPARSGWAEILELAERIAPSPSLVPKDIEERVKMLGLAHEMMGEGGILWNARIHAVHLGLTTNGERGFPPPVAAYLGKRYGYAKERASDALAIVFHRRSIERARHLRGVGDESRRDAPRRPVRNLADAPRRVRVDGERLRCAGEPRRSSRSDVREASRASDHDLSA